MTVIASNAETYSIELHFFNEKTVYECRIWLTPEETGGYSAELVSLPGVASQGDTEDEAIQNLTEAFRAAVEAYTEGGGEIPWTTEVPQHRAPDAKEKRVLVNVG